MNLIISEYTEEKTVGEVIATTAEIMGSLDLPYEIMVDGTIAKYSIIYNHVCLNSQSPSFNRKEMLLIRCATLTEFKLGLDKRQTSCNVNLNYPGQCDYTLCQQTLKFTSNNKTIKIGEGFAC